MPSAQPMSTRRKTALQVLKGFEDWKLKSIMEYRTEDCVQDILPTSLNRPPLGNEEYIAFLTPILGRLKNFKVTTHSIIEDPVDNKIVIYCSSVADVVEAGEQGKGAYGNEYVLFLEFNEDGTKVKRFGEYVDSQRTIKNAGVLMPVYPKE